MRQKKIAGRERHTDETEEDCRERDTDETEEDCRERHADETEEGCREGETQVRQKKNAGRETHR